MLLIFKLTGLLPWTFFKCLLAIYISPFVNGPIHLCLFLYCTFFFIDLYILFIKETNPFTVTQCCTHFGQFNVCLYFLVLSWHSKALNFYLIKSITIFLYKYLCFYTLNSLNKEKEKINSCIYFKELLNVELILMEEYACFFKNS